MQENKEITLDAITGLKRALLKAIGPNDPYPTPGEIAAHKQRADRRLKYQNLTLANHAN